MAYVNVLEWGAHQVSEWLQGELVKSFLYNLITCPGWLGVFEIPQVG